MKKTKTTSAQRFSNETSPINFISKKFQTAMLFCLLAIFAVNFYAAPQADGVDPNFNVQVQTNSFGTKSINTMLALPDDKMLAAGNFNSFNRQPTSGLIRLTSDGLLDTTFNNSLLAPDALLSKLYLQPDGKILIVGFNYKLNGSTAFAPSIVRLNADGTVDSSFNFFGGSAATVYALAIGTDGKILVSGGFPSSVGGVTSYKLLVRLNSDGSLDNSFNYTGTTSVTTVALQNSKPLIAYYDAQSSQEVLSRLNLDGSLDSSFPRILSEGSTIRVITALPDGKILLLSDKSLRRFSENGAPDANFQTITTPGTGRFFYIGADGRITYSTMANGGTATQIRRVSANGTPDATFTNYTQNGSMVFALQSDGEIFIGDVVNGNPGTSIINQYIHLFADGTVDSAFNPGGTGFQSMNQGSIGALAVQPDQKIIMAGKFDIINNVNRSKIARLNTDNTIDDSFQLNTGATGNRFSRINEIYNLNLLSSGKILVTGDFNYVLNGASKASLVRLNSDGSIDPTFNVGVFLNDIYAVSGGGKNKLVVQNDGKLVIGASRVSITDPKTPLRLTADGVPDSSFNPTLYNTVNALFIYDVAIQPDQKILISGITLPGNTVPSSSFTARLNADGSVDSSFVRNEEPGKVTGALTLLPDGRILIARGNPSYYLSSQVAVLRLNADGTPDVSFVVGAGANGHINRILPMPNGQTLVGGKFTTFNGQPRQNLALLNANGSVASTTYNVNEEVKSLALDGANRILVGGNFTVINVNNGQNYSRSYVARLTVSPQAGRTRFDFDGDGRADLATFTASTGIWSILNSQNSQIVNTQFGANGDRYAPADYDNDGKTDIAVYRPSNGTWYLLQSTAGFAALQWGTAEDKPVPGDFDGDGKAELAVWRPSNGVWYILRRATDTILSYSYFQFGTNGDIPLSADFDADGKTDIAVWRPSNGTFYWAASGSGNLIKGVQFGTNGDVPAIGDYNGDGKADLVVWRPTNGVWYQYLSTATDNFTFSAVQFGLNGDVPVAADYDGDGKADIAVRRGNIWYILNSTLGFSSAAFSNSTALPVAAVQN